MQEQAVHIANTKKYAQIKPIEQTQQDVNLINMLVK